MKYRLVIFDFDGTLADTFHWFGQVLDGATERFRLSAYGTMGQNGNMWGFQESAFDGVNDVSSENRVRRGGYWNGGVELLRSSKRTIVDAGNTSNGVGFRVASVPEPSSADDRIRVDVAAKRRRLSA
jgi:phosphoglycolate phosphatase-like HAD superfamily hydrolase